MSPDAYAIIGLQFGSEGKGALSGYLADKWEPDTCAAALSPNAGHTYRRDKSHKLVVRCIPIGAYSKSCRYALLGPGSIIDPLVLTAELLTVPDRVRVVIHPQAAICLARHRDAEVSLSRIGSTMKGSAAAAMERMMRNPELKVTAREYFADIQSYDIHSGKLVIDETHYHHILGNSRLVQVEGCQGYSLSLYHGIFPYVTSRDTSIHQLKADIGWHGDTPLEVYGCLRTFPIRVANRENGTSGPCYIDQEETSFEELGVPQELTTVTQLPRRIFTFSFGQLNDALLINRPKHLYLSFCDYLKDDDEALINLLEGISSIHGEPVRWQSFGPLNEDMLDLTELREI